MCGSSCRRNAKSVRTAVSRKIGNFTQDGNIAKLHKTDGMHLTDFDPPIYNIWKQQSKTAGVNHFGNSELRWVDNLLYLYTKPFDIVVDSFAGGGSTNAPAVMGRGRRWR
jgi:hypothetical protein